ncbi:hypothetical protein QQZ08_001078 [Neonectria magnoliae]|uniref:Uncharacterized protein n=1 Tax=Neonectria magnoliae TaxID=2732573 RepID=A0ABR1II37_9HYPO
MPPKRRRATTSTRGSDSFPSKRVAQSPLQDRQHHRGDSPQDTVDDRGHPEPMETNHPANPPKRVCEEGSPKSIIAEENMPDLLIAQLPDTPLPNTQQLDTQQPDAQLSDAQLRDAQLKVDEEDKSITAEENVPKPIIAQSPDAEELEKRQFEELTKSDLSVSLTKPVLEKEFWKPFPHPQQNNRWENRLAFADDAYSHLSGCWHALSDDVSDFAYSILPEDASWDSLDADTKGRVSKWAGNKGKQYIEGRGGTGEPMTLFEAWVWHILYDNLLSPACTDKWRGESWAAYGKLRLELRGHITDADNSFTRSYHSWRYTSARMLSALHGSHTDPERLKRIVKDELDQLIQIRGVKPEFLNAKLNKIVDEAVKLDFLVEVVKANISFEMHHPETRELSGFIYKKGDVAMAVDDPDPHRFDGCPVDFIKRPAMRQYGKVRSDSIPLFGLANHPGEFFYKDYHQCAESCPMVVVVKEKEGKEA